MGRQQRSIPSRQQRRQQDREERKHKKQRELEAERANPPRRRRRIWPFVVGLVVIGLICIAVAATLVRERSTQLTGRLAGIRELSFVEGSQADGGISPVCGCKKPRLNAWRGISFAARGIRLDRRGAMPWTRWTFSAAEPDTVEPMGSLQRLRVVAVKLRPNEPFDPHWMLNGEIGQHGQLLSKTSFRGRSFSFYTHHDLRLAMLGSVPVGAWVPYPGSKVNLTSQQSEFFAENVNSRIEERYPANIGVHERRGRGGLWTSEPQVVPIGDFLGPNLVIWSEDPAASLFGTSLAQGPRRGVVTALLIGDSNFSTRIAVTPVGWADIGEVILRSAKEPRHAREDLYFGDAPAGKLTITVEKALGQHQYETLKQRVREHPRTSVLIRLPPEELDLKGGKFGLPANVARAQRAEIWSQEERYPPLPRYSGLNIFGPLREVAFRGVHGHLMIADKDVSLEGSATLALGDVHGFQDEGGHQLISAPLATARRTADLQFEAVGTARINNVLKTTEQSHVEPKLAGVGLVLAILASVVGIISSLWRARLPANDK